MQSLILPFLVLLLLLLLLIIIIIIIIINISQLSYIEYDSTTVLSDLIVMSSFFDDVIIRGGEVCRLMKFDDDGEGSKMA